MLDIHQLHIFLVSAETLSFTQAAHRLHMSQPSISQHIQLLERHFNCDLFLRNGRVLELTDAGMTLVPMAREAVALSVRIDETMASQKGDVIGHLMVGCSTTPGKYVLPHLLAHFHERYPKVRVTCNVCSQNSALKMLWNGEVHFALVSLEREHQPDFEYYRYLCDRIQLITPLGHPWAQRGEITLDDLKSGRYILREETSGTYIAVSESLGRGGVSMADLDNLLTLGNSEAIALAVQEGLGVGFVSEIILDRLVGVKVARVNIHDIAIQREIFFTRNLRHPATVAQNAFWNFLKTEQQVYCKEYSAV
jgi:DNA-binding transcriptional LysR family regulator